MNWGVKMVLEIFGCWPIIENDENEFKFNGTGCVCLYRVGLNEVVIRKGFSHETTVRIDVDDSTGCECMLCCDVALHAHDAEWV